MAISILLDTYNHARFLRQAIDSVLAQESVDWRDVDFVVVDDGSTDSTPDIVKSYGRRVRYLRKENGGQASAFNEGIRSCHGDLVAFLDGDDWWHPRKLKSVIDAFGREPALVAVGHGIVETDEVGGRTYEVRPDRPTILRFDTQENARIFLKFCSCLGTSRLTARRDVLLSLLDVPGELTYEADEYLFTLLPACGDVAILDQCLTYYRIHGDNLFHSSRTVMTRNVSQVRIRSRATVYACLSRTLPVALKARGCPEDVMETVLAPVFLSAARLRLATGGGGRWENFLTEARAAGSGGRSRTLIDRVVLTGTLLLALLLPPRIFFALRSRYSRSALHRILRGTGTAREAGK